MDYELGLATLKARLPTSALNEFQTYEGRLQDNLDRERLFGGTEQTRAERATILHGLNRLARDHAGVSFNDMCRPAADMPPAATPSVSPVAQGQAYAYWPRGYWPGDRAPSVPPADRGQTPYAAPHISPPGPIQNRWALLVGVDHYVDPAIPALRFCVNDVLALEGALKGLGYTVVALHDQATQERLLPTRDNVEAELARLAQVAGPDDLLLVHLACHGKLVNGQAVLITREVRAPTLAEKALPLVEVERRMRHSQARRLVLILDACHTGVEIGRDLADPEFMRNAYDLAEGFALLAASTAQQVAQEWSKQQHGVFTYYLLEGLSGQADRQGKRFVTVDDLKTHVLNGLRRWSVEHGGLLQEPTARTEGLGDIILADYRRHLPEGAGEYTREPSGR